MAGWQDGRLSHKKPRSTNPQTFSSRTGGEGGPEGNRLIQAHLEKRPLNGSSISSSTSSSSSSSQVTRLFMFQNITIANLVNVR